MTGLSGDNSVDRSDVYVRRHGLNCRPDRRPGEGGLLDGVPVDRDNIGVSGYVPGFRPDYHR